MTEKQQRFVDEYVKDLNAKQAAIRAGYSEETAYSIGGRLLKNVEVRSAIDLAQSKMAGRNAATAQRTIEELANIAFSDIGELVDFADTVFRIKPGSEIPVWARKAISSVKVRREKVGLGDAPVEVVEFKLWDKVSALEKLAKILGLMKERHEFTGKDGGPIEHGGTIKHVIDIPDITADEFRALPIAEQLRRTREAIAAVNGN